MGEGAASEEVWIEPKEMDLADSGQTVEVAIAYEQRALYSPKLTHLTSSGQWEELTDVKYETTTNSDGEEYTVAMANVNEGGGYVVEDQVNLGAVVAITMLALCSSVLLVSSCGGSFSKLLPTITTSTLPTLTL